LKISIPIDVNFIISTLENSGFEAFIVGGCVRDAILGRVPEDWDITTNAKPSQIKECFKGYNFIDNGEKHGTIGVIINKTVYEITTYRIDGEYCDCRHPEKVEFTDDITADLSRRDFTINAIAYNEKVGFVDPFNGISDISLKAIRCVGEPDERFQEDALRILRALRFSSVFDFSIEVRTANSLIQNRQLLNKIAVERIATEFNKLICGKNVGYILRRYKDVIAVFLPELVSTFNCEQNTPHHNKNVWKHTTVSVANIEADLLLRMVMLFHDIGKPMAKFTDIKGRDHFHKHPKFSAEITKNALERLKYPNSFIENVVTLVRYHDNRGIENKKQIKRLLNKIGETNFRHLLKVQRADISAQSTYQREEKLNFVNNAESLFEEILRDNECFTLKNLAINGSDLLHMGVNKGVQIGYILNELLTSVIDGDVENEKSVLLELAKTICKQIEE